MESPYLHIPDVVTVQLYDGTEVQLLSDETESSEFMKGWARAMIGQGTLRLHLAAKIAWYAFKKGKLPAHLTEEHVHSAFNHQLSGRETAPNWIRHRHMQITGRIQLKKHELRQEEAKLLKLQEVCKHPYHHALADDPNTHVCEDCGKQWIPWPR